LGVVCGSLLDARILHQQRRHVFVYFTLAAQCVSDNGVLLGVCGGSAFEESDRGLILRVATALLGIACSWRFAKLQETI
jgi:hypothetical protein